MTAKQLKTLRSLTSAELLAAFERAGYTYRAGELRGTQLGSDLCERLGHLETRSGQLVIDFRFQDEDGEWTAGKAYVTLDAAGNLVAEH